MDIVRELPKIALLLFCLVLFMVGLTGCSIDESKKAIFDDAKRIAQEGDSYSFYERIGEQDEKHLSIKYSRFYGVQTIWVIEPQKQSEIKINYESQVSKGKFKVVLITPESEVIKIAEQDSKGTYKVTATKGKYTVKIVGKDAKGSISLERLSP